MGTVVVMDAPLCHTGVMAPVWKVMWDRTSQVVLRGGNRHRLMWMNENRLIRLTGGFTIIRYE